MRLYTNKIFNAHLLSKVLGLIVVLSLPSFTSAQVTSQSDGDWSSGSTWGGNNNKPTNNEDVEIQNKVTVTKKQIITSVSFSSSGELVISSGSTLEVGGNLNAANGTITVNGTLELSGDNSQLNNFRNGNFSGPVTFPGEKSNGDSLVYPLNTQNGMPAIAIGDAPAGQGFTINKKNIDPKTDLGSALGSGLSDISNAEYLDINPNATLNSNVRITLFWGANSQTDFSQVNQTADLTVAHWNSSNSEWDDFGNGGSGGSVTGEGYVTSNPTQNFSPFTYGSTNTNSPLPVELTYFEANSAGSDVTLEWKTASETNNSHFLIQRRLSSGGFENIGRKAGFGTSYEPHTYTFRDQVQTKGPVYYRLKQVDYDGSFEYSDIRAVEVNGKQSALELSITNIYPNPFVAQLQIQVRGTDDQEVRLELRSVSGDLQRQKNIQGDSAENRITWNGLGSLPSGTYIITAQTSESRAVKRIVKQ